jgi:hypothetical protein
VVRGRLIREATKSGYSYTDSMYETDFKRIRRDMRNTVKDNAKDFLGVLLARINMERQEIWAEIEFVREAAPDVSTERREILVNALDKDGNQLKDAKGDDLKKPVAGHVRVIQKQRGSRNGIAALFERLAELNRQEIDLLGLRQPQRERHEIDDEPTFEPKVKTIDYGAVNAVLRDWASGNLNGQNVIEAEVVSVSGD